MAITLFNGVRRRSHGSYSVLYQGAGKSRPIVVTLARNDTLIFREHQRRESWAIAVEDAFRYAVRCRALAAQLAKARGRKAARAARRLKRAERKLFSTTHSIIN
jgi:hypothetical protein